MTGTRHQLDNLYSNTKKQPTLKKKKNYLQVNGKKKGVNSNRKLWKLLIRLFQLGILKDTRRAVLRECRNRLVSDVKCSIKMLWWRPPNIETAQTRSRRVTGTIWVRGLFFRLTMEVSALWAPLRNQVIHQHLLKAC